MDDHSRTASISADPALAEIIVRFTYDATVVDSIKALPRFARRWDPRAKAWLIDAAHHTAVVLILRRAGYQVIDHEVIDQDDIGGAPSVTSPCDAYRAALDACPQHLRQSLYRAMLGVLHPDRGGDTDAVRELIAAGGDGR